MCALLYCWGGNTFGNHTTPQKNMQSPQNYAKPEQTIQNPKIFYRDPKDYTKPRHTTQSPNRLNKSSQESTQRSTKTNKDCAKTQAYWTQPKILDNKLRISNQSSNKY